MFKFNQLYQESLQDAFGGLGDDKESEKGGVLKRYERTIINGYFSIFSLNPNETKPKYVQHYIGPHKAYLQINDVVNVNFNDFFSEYSEANKSYGGFEKKKKQFLTADASSLFHDKGFDIFWKYFIDPYLSLRQELWESLKRTNTKLLDNLWVDHVTSIRDQIDSNSYHTSVGPNYFTFAKDTNERVINSKTNSYNSVYMVSPFFIASGHRADILIIYTMNLGGFTSIDDPTDNYNNEKDFSRLYDYLGQFTMPRILPFIKYNHHNQWRSHSISYQYE